MADDQQLELKPQGSGKKKLIIIIAIALVVLIGGGVGAWLFLSHGKANDEAKAAEAAAAAAKQAKLAFYVVLPRPFVFNVAAKPRFRLVQIKVALVVRGQENQALAQLHTPLIEGAIFKVFSAATAEQLDKPEGRVQLKVDALAAVKQAVNDVAHKTVVDQILFTGFVMQQ